MGSDVVCSTGLGSARASMCGTDNKTTHAFFLCLCIKSDPSLLIDYYLLCKHRAKYIDMKQSERASIFRIVTDLIKADAIIDMREIEKLDSIRERFAINPSLIPH